jgi:hypothetical protein
MQLHDNQSIIPIQVLVGAILCRFESYRAHHLHNQQVTEVNPAKVDTVSSVMDDPGDSPSIIFKNYRELTTEDQADKWFSILPKEGQSANTFLVDKRTGKVVLNGKRLC